MRKYANNASTTVAAPVAAIDTTITVADASVYPTIVAGDRYFVTLDDQAGAIEIVDVTSVSGNILTVVRARQDTSAQAWATGVLAVHRWTAEDARNAIGRHVFSYPSTGEVWEKFSAAIPTLASPAVGALLAAPHHEEYGRAWPGGIIIRHQTGSAGEALIGIYSADPTNGRPDELLWSYLHDLSVNGTHLIPWTSGTFTAAGTEFENADGDLELPVGSLVWKAMVLTGTTAQFVCLSTGGAKPLGFAGYAVSAICFERAGQASLPDPWGDSSTEISTTTYPIIGFLGE